MTRVSKPEHQDQTICKMGQESISEETGTIHLRFCPPLLGLYIPQPHLSCAVLPKSYTIFCSRGAALTTRGHPLPGLSGFLPLPLLSCSVPVLGPLLLSFIKCLNAAVPPLTKVHSFTDSPCHRIPLFLSHLLVPLPLCSVLSPVFFLPWVLHSRQGTFLGDLYFGK